MRTSIFCIIGSDAEKLAVLLVNTIVRYNFAVFPSNEEWKYFYALKCLAQEELAIPSGFDIKVYLPFLRHIIMMHAVHSPVVLTRILRESADAFLLSLPADEKKAIDLLKSFILVASYRMFPFFWKRRVRKSTLIITKREINISSFAEYFSSLQIIYIPGIEFDFHAIFDEKRMRVLMTILQWLNYTCNIGLVVPI